MVAEEGKYQAQGPFGRMTGDPRKRRVEAEVPEHPQLVCHLCSGYCFLQSQGNADGTWDEAPRTHPPQAPSHTVQPACPTHSFPCFVHTGLYLVP